VPAVSFEGTIGAADFALAPTQGLRSADDVFAAIVAGKGAVLVPASATRIGGRLVRKD
jgi:hypothetical protein